MQTTITSGVKENTAPIKVEELKIQIPNINNIPPKDIKVNANSMIATTGEENGLSFDENNYSINEGIITINVQNMKDGNQNISWKKQGQNEYVITYIYPEEALNSEKAIVNMKVNSNITLYNASETLLQANYENELEMKEKIGNVVDFTIEATESLSKGQIYANYIANEKQEIIYNEKIIANIGLANLIDEIVINQNADAFKTSKPQKEGKLEINLEKAIKTDIDYSKAQISKMEKLNTQIKAVASLNGEILVEQNIEANINLVEPQAKVELYYRVFNISKKRKCTNKSNTKYIIKLQ